ncbi:cytochrome aa3 quinol oxidase subunit II [Aquibacillus salsiterrae]|uniref:Quinol oxidase subunit 2 n=1 Tax=Aquibacillus salsiterrae TaxID=2950439 RepID=A0A9X3WC81_9BACI|nr:cytochrome aa3 quinol oxidase subunit II [Aquibacillus salsiterrae]MDC3416757.1 cytochrome aa3 quinol oxidase subunit II [Aquibacillus salsiterrae]
MTKKLILFSSIFAFLIFLTGCQSLTVLDPKGPQAETTADVIMTSIWTMLIIVIVVFILLIVMLVKYRARNQADDYEPPYIKGNKWVEIICVGIPIIIVIFLSVITVKSTYEVEGKPKGYENDEPLVIYAASSNWKWHFSYPEENIETVNYVFIPTDRPIEFKLYAYGPIASFWVPQLAGQKYAMANMVNTLNLAATEPGEYMGRNASFTGEGFAEQTFNVTALPPADYQTWIEEIQATAEPLTEDKFNQLLEPGRLGQETYTGTHLEFSPPPTTHHGAKESDGTENTEQEMNDSMEDSMEN